MRYCEEYSALLDLYIDGELPPQKTAQVREHLHTCDGCRAYVQAALAIRDAFPLAEDTPVPDGFAEGVMAAIRADAAPRKRYRIPWAKTLLPLAACCAIVLLVRSLPHNAFLSNAATADTASPPIETAANDQTAECAADSAPFSYAADSASLPPVSEEEGPVFDNKEQDVPEKGTAPLSMEPQNRSSQPEEGVAISTQSVDQDADLSHCAIVTLVEQDVGDLLTGYTPVSQETSPLCYELSYTDYTLLLEQLAARGITPVDQLQGNGNPTGTALVYLTVE